MAKKWHRNCGGIVKFQKPLHKTNFEQAGYCLKCEAFPLTEEEIMFEIDTRKVEVFFNNMGWKILNKTRLSEVLD